MRSAGSMAGTTFSRMPEIAQLCPPVVGLALSGVVGIMAGHRPKGTRSIDARDSCASVLDFGRRPRHISAMRKWLHIAIAAVLAILAGAIAWQLLRVREPVYQGKPLKIW